MIQFVKNYKQRKKFLADLDSVRDRLYRTAYSWSHDPDIADDIVQQTLFNVINNLSKVRDFDVIDGWVYKVLVRCYSDYYRKNNLLELSEEHEEVANYSHERNIDEEQLVCLVRDLIKNISLAQRQVLTLVDLDGFTYIEVANILSIPVGTVMSRLSRARKQLHKQLTNSHVSETATYTDYLRRVK